MLKYIRVFKYSHIYEYMCVFVFVYLFLCIRTRIFVLAYLCIFIRIFLYAYEYRFVIRTLTSFYNNVYIIIETPGDELMAPTRHRCVQM